MSVKSYAPELLDIFKLGSVKEFRHDCHSEKAAMNLRHRMHKLRREMRKEMHWLTPVAEQVVFSIDGTFLVAKPPDKDIIAELRESLKEQGLKEEKI